MKRGEIPSDYKKNTGGWFNDSVFKKKERYDFPECKDKSVICHLGTTELPMVVPCQCVRKKLDRKRYRDAMKASGLAKRFLDQTFENFIAPERWMADMKKAAVTWAQGNNGWLLLCRQ